MYEFIQGTIIDVTPTHVVIQSGGVGYLIYSPNPYRYQIGDENVRIYVYQSVSENAILLYGFYDQEDKQLFVKLIAVSGIGPKSALAILAGEDKSGLVSAINNEDVKFLTKFPGVGNKTAKQIILDLKGKLDDIDAGVESAPVSTPVVENQALNDAVMALSALGYSDKQVASVKKDLADREEMSTDEYLSLALKLLVK
ncbi:Holliday junction branch migration protein RuvA [Lentilactobacillus sp. Marseille-Q4993]|uniref:Holliday junction branch migration protein RuvA n=1 Tax=Lentilactobacillus sp. Marseille-Q4993 TaxID=3039492 RepID=UPI0024BC1431|nr:Holliday junction branch migration protein RuvA [Lentilactobacillus sp. Marseille-Q4993]